MGRWRTLVFVCSVGRSVVRSLLPPSISFPARAFKLRLAMICSPSPTSATEINGILMMAIIVTIKLWPSIGSIIQVYLFTLIMLSTRGDDKIGLRWFSVWKWIEIRIKPRHPNVICYPRATFRRCKHHRTGGLAKNRGHFSYLFMAPTHTHTYKHKHSETCVKPHIEAC